MVPLLLLQVFQKPIVMVGKPDLIEYILTDGQNSGIFRRSPSFYNAYEEVFGVHLGNQSDEEWKWRRQAAAPSFRASQFTQKLDVIVESCQQVIHTLQAYVGETVEVDPLFVDLTMGVIGYFFLGAAANEAPNFDGEPPFNAQEIYKALGVLEKHVLLQASGRSAWLKRLPTAEGRRYQDAQSYLKQMLSPRVEMAMALAHTPQPNDKAVHQRFKDSMLAQLAKNPKHNATSLMATTRAFIFAGHDTTAHTMSFAVGELGLNAEVRCKAQNLIDQVWEQEGGITINALKELVYVEAIVKEAMRLHPVATGIPLVASQDTELDDIKIPKGTGIEPFFLEAGRNAQMYPDPGCFQTRTMAAQQ